MKPDSIPKDPLAQINEAIRRIDWKMDQDEGKELTHIRSTEIPDELKAKLANIGAKASSNGTFNQGNVTWGDYYNFTESVWSLIPNFKKLKPSYFASAEEFAKYMSRDESSTSNTPIDAKADNRLLLWKFKVSVSNRLLEDDKGMEFTITPDSRSTLARTMTGEVYNKVRAVGLPLRDTTWRWK